MAFVVRAIPGTSGEGAFIVHMATPKDALETAVGLPKLGMSDVTIVDDNGRAYTTSEFAKAFAKDT